MFGKIREKYGKAEAPLAQEVELTDEALSLAKKVVFLSREPVSGPNPALEQALQELAAELGAPDMEIRTVQEKAHEIDRNFG